jgi:hypothetical protein
VASGPVHVERLFLKAAETLPRERIAAALDLENNSYPRLCENAARIMYALSLSTAEARFLSAINGARTMLELVSTRMADDSDPAPLLAALILSGFVETRPFPSRVPMSRTLRAVNVPLLGQSMPAASAQGLPPVFETTSVRPRPALLPSFVDVESEATLSLGKVKRRIDRCDFTAALAELERMVFAGDSVECATYRAWAEFRNRGNLAATSSRLAMKRTARAALNVNASFGFAYYVLAQIAKLEGDDVAAARLMERASTLEHDREADDGSYRILRSSEETIPPPSMVRRKRHDPPAATATLAPPSDDQSRVAAG